MDDYGLLEDLPDMGGDWGEPAYAASAPEVHAAPAVKSGGDDDQYPPVHKKPAKEDADSGVDGIGMWKSWTHNYNEPKDAVLDLLDNCFDATLNLSLGKGRVTMDFLAPNGVVVTNNSAKRIKPLKDTLTAYRSQKNANAKIKDNPEQPQAEVKKDVIGEYGVGLKQACATLSNTSFVLTKNISPGSSTVDFELGVISEALQTHDSVVIPHFPFAVDNNSQQPAEEQIQAQLQQIFHEEVYVKNLFTNSIGRGNRHDGLKKLVQHCMDMLVLEHWKQEQYVFRLLLTDLKHISEAKARLNEEGQPVPAAVDFLEDIRCKLPKQYINVPLHNFEFIISNKPVKFCYWQHRLVEMTKFEVFIPKEKPVQNYSDKDPWAQEGYPLSIYCGFDALRLDEREAEKLPKTCALYTYSRQSGRLIEQNLSAREVLGMGSSGVDYCQGLTIIIDDVTGELPLKPTKDGLTWSKDQLHGETHRTNLLAWTGAVGKMYWGYHKKEFEKRTLDYKSTMKTAVISFADSIEARLKKYDENPVLDTTDPSLERVEKAKFCMFADVRWKKSQDRNTMKVKIQTVSRKLDLWRENTPATVWKFNQSHYPAVLLDATPQIVKKRSRSNAKSSSKKQRKSSHAAQGLSAMRPSSVGSGAAMVSPWDRFQTKNGNDSSSGEEEEVVAVGSPAGKGASRTINFGSPMAVRSGNGNSVPGLPEMAQSSTYQPPANPFRVEELEEELKKSREQVEMLQTQVLKARNELRNQQQQSQSGNDALVALEQERQQNAQLRQQNRQLQQQGQGMVQARQALQKMQEENQRIQQEKVVLQQQKDHAEQNGQGMAQAQQALQRMQAENQRIQQEQVVLQQQKDKAEKHAGAYELSLRTAVQENTQLKQKVTQLELNLQEVKDGYSYEVRKKELEVEALKLELSQRDKTIERMSGGSGFHWGQGTDEI